MNIPQYITQITKQWLKYVSKKFVQGSFIRIDEAEDTRTISVDVDALKTQLDSISFDTTQQGVVYNTYGTVSYKTDLYAENGDKLFVATTGAQTIAGEKTFTNDYNITLQSTSATRGDGTINGPVIQFKDILGNRYGIVQARDKSIIISSTNGNAWNQFTVGFDSNNQITVTRSALAADFTANNSQEVPTCGWTNEKFIRKTAAGAANGVASLNSSTKVPIAQLPTGTTSSSVALGDHTHTHDKISDWSTATENFLTEAELEEDFVAKTDLAKDDDDCFKELIAQHGHWTDNVFVVKSGGTMTTLSNYFTSDNKLDATKIKLKTNGGLTADSNGLCIGGMTQSKWVVTDSNGKITTTDEEPVSVDPSTSGVLYNAAGTLTYKTDLYAENGDKLFVATTGAQTIAGEKTFTNAYNITLQSTTATRGDGSTNGPVIQFKDRLGNRYGIVQARNKSIIISSTNGNAWNEFSVGFDSDNQISVKRSALAADFTANNSQEVPTCGWTNDKFIRKTKIGQSNGVQAYSAKLTALNSLLNDNGTLSSSAVSDQNCTSGGDCLAYFDASKNLSHMGTTGLTRSRANAINSCFTHTGSGSSMSSKLNFSSIGPGSSVPSSRKLIGFAANSSEASLFDGVSASLSASSIAQSLASIDSDGTLRDVIELPNAGTATDSDKVLTCKKGGVNLTWESSGGSPSDPGNDVVDEVESSNEKKTVLGNPWMCSNGKGVKVSFITRVVWTGTKLVQFYRIMKFDENGRLYSIGAEYDKDIDLAVNIDWR